MVDVYTLLVGQLEPASKLFYYKKNENHHTFCMAAVQILLGKCICRFGIKKKIGIKKIENMGCTRKSILSATHVLVF